MIRLDRKREIEIEEAVVELLEDFGIAQFPMSVERAAKALGVQLVPYSSLPDDEKALAFAASDDAFHIRTHDFMDARIVFDDTHGARFNRSRFSGGHEIGHIVLGHREDTPDREREVDYFSGYLFAPPPLVLKCKPGFPLDEVFGVSWECASFACNQAQARKGENAPWRPHERWLLENAVWKGGGLLGRI